MSPAERTSRPLKFAWLLIALGLPAALLRAEYHAGGYVPGEVSCPIAFARRDAPPADIVIFGSSRTGQVIDPVYIARSLGNAAPTAGEAVRVERLNSTGPDLVTSLWTLEEYLRLRGRPKLVILETMFRLKQGSDVRGEKDLFWPRHHSILPLGQIRRFRDLYESPTGMTRVFQGLNDGFRRVTNLLHGLVKDPLGRRWNADHCSIRDLTRDGEWAWDEADEAPAPADAVVKARADAQALFDRRPANPWKWGRRELSEASFDVEAAHRQREVDMLRRVITTANDAGIPVLLLPLVNFATVVNDNDRKFFLALGDRTHWFDVYREIGEPMTSHHLWRDPLHVKKTLAPLVSALVARRAGQILADD